MNIVLINDLIDQHGDSFLDCKGCTICDEISSLRTERPLTEKFKHILDKGRHMTKSDIAFLLENEVEVREIKKALKMSDTTFYKLRKN